MIGWAKVCAECFLNFRNGLPIRFLLKGSVDKSGSTIPQKSNQSSLEVPSWDSNDWYVPASELIETQADLGTWWNIVDQQSDRLKKESPNLFSYFWVSSSNWMARLCVVWCSEIHVFFHVRLHLTFEHGQYGPLISACSGVLWKSGFRTPAMLQKCVGLRYLHWS